MIDLLLLDVTPLSINIKTADGLVRQMIRRNATIPTRGSHVFTKNEIYYSSDKQSVIIEIYEGERVMAKDNHLLGKFELKCSNLNETTEEIEIKCDLDANGVLTVVAIDLSSGNINKIKITNDQGRLSSEEINQMVDDYEKNRQLDEIERERILEAQSRRAYENDNMFSLWKRLSTCFISKNNNSWLHDFKIKTCYSILLNVSLFYRRFRSDFFLFIF